jgi:hypothetical protein
MNTHMDRSAAPSTVESRRLWDDTRVWVINCLGVQPAIAALPMEERVAARRGCDRMLEAFLQVW